jgi:hypothetical protein
MKKKIAILISGNIRLFQSNLPFLKKILTNFNYSIFATVWKNQENLDEFKKLYNPIKIEEITKKIGTTQLLEFYMLLEKKIEVINY